MLKDNHHKGSWFKNKNLIAASSLVLLVLTALFVAKPLYDEYHDRPLAASMQYIGRDYNSPCSPLFGCFGPTTETFYYATNSNPDTLLESFSGWTLESKIEGIHYTTSGSVSAIGYNLLSGDDTYVSVNYIPNKHEISQLSKLLPTDKQYILSISRENYDQLRNIRH